MNIMEAYTGGEHYFILYKFGTHHLCRVTKYGDDYVIESSGTFEECMKALQAKIESNYEYDLNL